MFDQRLIQMINRGRCFILVGSGASCEMGYPSWAKLAEDVFDRLSQDGLASDKGGYQNLLNEKKYPELFRQAEIDIGEREKLVSLIKSLLTPAIKERGILYELITKWPVACYLTTNYDDEINEHLKLSKTHFQVLRNRKEDFYPFRDGASNLILKLHSDLKHPQELILTSLDYKNFYVDDSGQYFRDKLRMIFETFDILIIGHSLSDPDIQYVLKTAKQTANPDKPIFMFATGLTQIDEREFIEQYNINLIRYKNDDGKHSKLKNYIRTINSFIISRDKHHGTLLIETPPKEEIEGATSLFLFRKLHETKFSTNFSPLILSTLSEITSPGISVDEILSKLPLIQSKNNPEESKSNLQKQLSELVDSKLTKQQEEKFSLTEKGQEQADEIKSIRDSEKNLAFGQFIIDLKNIYSRLSSEQEKLCCQLAEKVLVDSYKERGLTIANKVFSGQTAGPEELSDIFILISQAAGELGDLDLGSAFLEAMNQFIVYPNESQKKFLASLFQGYFLFHMLGLDPKCSKLRKEIFQQTIWFCDSSVLLPLAAIGCYNHDYAKKLFHLLNETDSAIYSTHNLLQEAWEHLEWAVNFVKGVGIESPDFLRAAMVKGTFKQNLFLDGYIQSSSDGQVGTFKDYLEKVCPGDLNQISFNKIFDRYGIQIVTLSDLEGFVQEDWGELEETKKTIKEKRIEIGTFRSDLQVDAEAEIMVIINNLQSGKYIINSKISNVECAYFLSQSQLLNKILSSDQLVTWTPKGVYLYLSSMPNKFPDPTLLQQCLLHEYYYAGISFIDQKKYKRFFGPSIDAAKVSFEKEKEKYINIVESRYAEKLDETFEKVPDLEKPFFVSQMGWKVAEHAQNAEALAKERAEKAEAKIKQLETEKAKAWKKKEKTKEKQEAARLRNLKDPKHVRKLKRQQKKRKKKK